MKAFMYLYVYIYIFRHLYSCIYIYTNFLFIFLSDHLACNKLTRMDKFDLNIFVPISAFLRYQAVQIKFWKKID